MNFIVICGTALAPIDLLGSFRVKSGWTLIPAFLSSLSVVIRHIHAVAVMREHA